MAKRFYIVPIIGTGVRGDTFRAKIGAHPHVCFMPYKNDRSGPKFSFCIALVGGADHSDLDADPDLDKFFTGVLTDPLSDFVLNNGQLNALKNRMQNRFGIDASSLTRASTVADALNLITLPDGLDFKNPNHRFDVRDNA